MTQREGRILRQGNTNPKVYIYRYITEGSFDAYSWQLLETKQRFISALLSGSLTGRSSSDIDDTVLDYAEVKAIAVGNPLVKQRVEAANELSRYLILQRQHIDNQTRLSKELMELPGMIEYQRGLIDRCTKDIEFCGEWSRSHPLPKTTKEKKEDAEARKVLREQISKALTDNERKPNESVLMNYRGFDVVLPANMLPGQPYVFLVREGRYHVEFGDSGTGNLIRIDNTIDTLADYLEKLKNGLQKFLAKQASIEQELNREEDYTEQIETYKNKVEKLDKKLGAKEK